MLKMTFHVMWFFDLYIYMYNENYVILYVRLPQLISIYLKFSSIVIVLKCLRDFTMHISESRD